MIIIGKLKKMSLFTIYFIITYSLIHIVYMNSFQLLYHTFCSLKPLEGCFEEV